MNNVEIVLAKARVFVSSVMYGGMSKQQKHAAIVSLTEAVEHATLEERTVFQDALSLLHP